jgi:hypothetical protein
MNPFDPGINQTIARANTTSSTGGALPDNADVVVLVNTSATATAYFVCTPLVQGSTAVAAVAPVAGGALGSFAIPPNSGLIRLTVPEGPKAYRAIASAADGNLLITPGRGN